MRRALQGIHGGSGTMEQERLALLKSVVSRHLERFGNGPLRVFRSPGRVNLRGMHVDTHGGYLNLMTHQRETIVAIRPIASPLAIFSNVDPRYPEYAFDLAGSISHPEFQTPWHDYIVSPGVQNTLQGNRGHWGHYIRGAVLRALHGTADVQPMGMQATVGSDLPAGAALSSSHALCTAVVLAVLALAGKQQGEAALIRIIQDAEWYTGARSGVSDQAAMILGGRNELVNVALLPSAIDVSGLRRMVFPESLQLLVVSSYTERSLSGANGVEYARNRFAYALALDIVRQQLVEMGIDKAQTLKIDRLAHLSPQALEAMAGPMALFNLLRAVPEMISLDALRSRYHPQHLDNLYEHYFGSVPMEARPQEIRLRGPLLFGIAESERARRFF